MKKIKLLMHLKIEMHFILLLNNLLINLLNKQIIIGSIAFDAKFNLWYN